MIKKPISISETPPRSESNLDETAGTRRCRSPQRLFGPKATAKYLGICEDTLKKITDLQQIRAFDFNGRRAYRIEDLDQFIATLPGWYDRDGENPAKVMEKDNS